MSTDTADYADGDDDLNFDFNTSEVKEVKDIGAGGGMLPDGFYHVTVENVEKDHNSATPCLKFTFGIIAGPCKGRKIFDRLFTTEKNNARVVLFGNRLGLLNQGDLGKTNVRKSWSDAIGKEVIVETSTREYEARDGSKKKASNLKFDGLYKLDDVRVKDVQRAGGTTTPATTDSAATDSTFNDL